MKPRLAEKAIVFALNRLIWTVDSSKNTAFICAYLRRRGMTINGRPNYVSAKVWFDGSDYRLIELNQGCTISSNVRILTHDWSIDTVGRAMGYRDRARIGVFRPVRIGRYAFVGTGAILMPGADIGDGAIVGAGAVVRGKVPDHAIVVGNPAQVVGDSREYTSKHFARKNVPLDHSPAFTETPA